MGNSIVELDKLDLADELLKKALDRNLTIHLPRDHVIGREFDPNTDFQVISNENIPDGWSGFDIGSETVAKFSEIVDTAKTIIWNGPLGVYEFDRFAKGTLEIARRVAESEAVSVVGGGDLCCCRASGGCCRSGNTHLHRRWCIIGIS